MRQIREILGEAFRGSRQDFTEGSIGRAIILLAVPMYLLYEGGLVAARIVVRRREKERERDAEGG